MKPAPNQSKAGKRSKKQPRDSTQAQTDTVSSKQAADASGAVVTEDKNADDGVESAYIEDVCPVGNRKLNASMLPMLRELQAKMRSDPGVQTALKYNLPEHVKADDSIQALPKLCYTSDAFGSELMQAAADSAAKSEQTLQAAAKFAAQSEQALQDEDSSPIAPSSSDGKNIKSKQEDQGSDFQETPIAETDSQVPESQADSQAGGTTSQQLGTGGDRSWHEASAVVRNAVAKHLLKSKVSGARWQAEEEEAGVDVEEEDAGVDMEPGLPFLPGIDLLQQFAGPSSNYSLGNNEQPLQNAVPNSGQVQQGLSPDAGHAQDHAQPLQTNESPPNESHKNEPSSGVGDMPESMSSAQQQDESESSKATFSERNAANRRTVNGSSLNLNGAQVLTPEGEWKRLDSGSQAGTAWTSGDCMTINTTTEYEMSAVSKQVVCVTCGWATIDAYALSERDVIDVYIKAVGLDRFDLAVSYSD